jgi:hypothetical protein
MKGCEEGGRMMMFVRMGGGVLGHHERLRVMRKEGGWSIMKK